MGKKIAALILYTKSIKLKDLKRSKLDQHKGTADEK